MRSVERFSFLDVIVWFRVFFSALFADRQSLARPQFCYPIQMTEPWLSRADKVKRATDASGLARNKKTALWAVF